MTAREGLPLCGTKSQPTMPARRRMMTSMRYLVPEPPCLAATAPERRGGRAAPPRAGPGPEPGPGPATSPDALEPGREPERARRGGRPSPTSARPCRAGDSGDSASWLLLLLPKLHQLLAHRDQGFLILLRVVGVLGQLVGLGQLGHAVGDQLLPFFQVGDQGLLLAGAQVVARQLGLVLLDRSEEHTS